MFTITSTGMPRGDQDPIDRKYLVKGTGGPFAEEFQTGTVCVGNRAPQPGTRSRPGAHSHDDADTTEEVQPPAADETCAFVRADHCDAELRHITGRASRRKEAPAAGNRRRDPNLRSDLPGDAPRASTRPGPQGGFAGDTC